MPGLGSSTALTLWSPCAETDVAGARPWSLWGRVFFLSAAVWASVIGNGLRSHCACPGSLGELFVPGSAPALDQSISHPVALLFLGQKGLTCTFPCNQGEGRTTQILG